MIHKYRKLEDIPLPEFTADIDPKIENLVRALLIINLETYA